jgi:hypothetical protein
MEKEKQVNVMATQAYWDKIAPTYLKIAEEIATL